MEDEAFLGELSCEDLISNEIRILMKLESIN
jgi:hypothetical protein